MLKPLPCPAHLLGRGWARRSHRGATTHTACPGHQLLLQSRACARAPQPAVQPQRQPATSSHSLPFSSTPAPPAAPASHDPRLRRTRRPSDLGDRSIYGLVTSYITSFPFLLHLLKLLFKNNAVQCGRDGQRAGELWFLSWSGEEQEKSCSVSQFIPDKLFCDSSSAGESLLVADAQEVIAGDGAADRLVLDYYTNHNSCFTTPLVGFKACSGGPAPVLVQRRQSSTGAGAEGPSPAPAPWASGHPQPPRLPDWRIFAGFLQAEDHTRAD